MFFLGHGVVNHHSVVYCTACWRDNDALVIVSMYVLEPKKLSYFIKLSEISLDFIVEAS